MVRKLAGTLEQIPGLSGVGEAIDIGLDAVEYV
jgi:hypothetical protein